LTPRSGFPISLALAAGLASGCVYGFAGGGLPPHVRTVAILPFENQTGEPSLTQEVSDAVHEALEGRLGLRSAAEEQADAVVRGTITSYDADVALSIQSSAAGDVSVTRRLVRIVVAVEIYDRVEDRVLWQAGGLREDGEYAPPNEKDGRQLALKNLVSDIVDGAQSQW